MNRAAQHGTWTAGAALYLCLAALAPAQTPPSHEILSGGGTLGSGIAVRYKTEALGPGDLAAAIGGGFRIEGDRLLRLLVDRNGRQYFGYQLAAAAAPAGGSYRVAIEPLAGIEELLRRFAPDWVLRPAPAPKYPAPQTVREGDAIALDLMTSPGGGERITDTIRLLSPTGAEVTTLDPPIIFKAATDLVSVPVVVRDAQGRAVADLKQEDFQLLDDGRQQALARFSVERSAQEPAGANLPGRYVAYLFDDLHLGYPDDPSYSAGIEDMERARGAAWRQIAALGSGERAAIYTTSGQIAVNFTADRERLRRALLAVRALGAAHKDPRMLSFWVADQLLNRGTLGPAGAGGGTTLPSSPAANGVSAMAAWGNSSDSIEYWNRDTRAALGALDSVVAKLASMPGRRSVVLVSPGFLVLSDSYEWETGIIDRAIREGVRINALDVKGMAANLNREIAADERAVPAELAAGTGGRFIENSNDLDQGFRLTAGAPEALYILGFAPRDLKLDGRYHALRVTLRNTHGLTVEARHGYYAPRYADTPAEQAKKQIEEAFFSTGEIRELPVTLETQFFKTGSDQATVDVLAKLDVRQLPFQKENGRNTNEVTVVSGLFDHDGNYVAGAEKVLELRLKDETLATRLNSGLAVRASFDVKPGDYVVRTVVRDALGQSLSALSAPMAIR